MLSFKGSRYATASHSNNKMEPFYIFIKNSDLDDENKFLVELTSHNKV